MTDRELTLQFLEQLKERLLHYRHSWDYPNNYKVALADKKYLIYFHHYIDNYEGVEINKLGVYTVVDKYDTGWPESLQDKKLICYKKKPDMRTYRGIEKKLLNMFKD